jgi:hypothetical protein
MMTSGDIDFNFPWSIDGSFLSELISRYRLLLPFSLFYYSTLIGLISRSMRDSLS